ncbi:MAG: bifunctional folylpolyglutamate synthase/dihydrofolate synthase [Lachnospiraceae bacterium]|nr:bifunctional folylpolyglutamate synthase/dihydrofolate synthase [Lachnospiraceae bacterium]
MTYEEAVSYIKETAAFGSKLGLDNIRCLMSFLGDPQEELRYIHIAGTNGKGSVAAYIASALKASGYRVGIYTSPELLRFSERIRINDVEISEEDIARYATDVRKAADEMISRSMGTPTEFELVMAMAFCYFRDKRTDAVILEVGMGGRLDATNVISSSLLTVITKISCDHMQYLGDTPAAIAGEKAAIIKPGGRVIVYPPTQDVLTVYEDECEKKEASLYVSGRADRISSELTEGQCFRLQGREYITSMPGIYEIDNAALAIQALELLRDDLPKITDDTVYEGIAGAVWPGRFEVLSKEPLIIADGAHNADGAKALTACLKEYFGDRKVRLCVGILKDKQYREMLELLLPFASSVIACEVPNPRSLGSAELKAVIEEICPGIAIETAYDVEAAAEAIKKPQQNAAADIICGSLYLVGPIREMLTT